MEMQTFPKKKNVSKMISGIKLEVSNKLVRSRFEQSPDFYANLQTGFVGRFEAKSRKKLTEIHVFLLRIRKPKYS